MFRWTIALLGISCGSVAVRADDSAVSDTKASVVKLAVTQRNPDFNRPWNKANPNDISGTGFVIAGNRILTNAHVVRYGSQIYVQPDRSDEKYEARVEGIAYDLDLAVVKLDNPDAIASLKPLAFEEAITPLRSEVNVYGFPIGGDQISITKGIVSRIENASLGPNGYGLRAQIDAAINPGNSGGPAIGNGGKVMGVAFSVAKANNIGYIIHSTEVLAFLKDIEDGKYDGKANIWDSFQTVENPALRARLKLPKNAGGVMVNMIRDDSDSYPLRVGDVVTKIGSHAIDSQGNVKVDELTLSFNYYSSLLAQGGKVPLTIWREGQESVIECPAPNKSRTMLPYLDGTYPRYFILGPLTFEAATGEFALGLLANGNMSMALATRKSPLVSQLQTTPKQPGDELVVIPAVPFSHRIMKGYRTPVLSTVFAVNGIEIRNLKHLVEVFRDCKDEFIVIDFVDRGVEKLVFHRKEFIESTEDILTDNNIRKQFSDDLAETWNGGNPK
ncbi:MAG: trypsin-like peptidase domain-containing protein [Pirellula sp.]